MDNLNSIEKAVEKGAQEADERVDLGATDVAGGNWQAEDAEGYATKMRRSDDDPQGIDSEDRVKMGRADDPMLVDDSTGFAMGGETSGMVDDRQGMGAESRVKMGHTDEDDTEGFRLKP